MAQSITGSIVGTVRDPGALAVTGADVTLIQTATGAGRQARTGERGDFVFGAVQPGEYTIAITHEGFKKTERAGIVLSASEILSTGVIVLSLGSISDSVTVTATGAVVQTASAERAGSVTGNQVDNLLIRGRNVMSLVGLLPGVVDLLDNDAINRSWNLNVNGSRRNTTSVSLDGMTLNNSGNQFNSAISVSQDSVAEVKILLSNYQAEYGRMSGANIQLVSKSGTRDFHGLGSYFKRHEQFNANDYFNNQRGIPKPRYRYNTWSYNVGGPAYIPGKFNRNRDKLFFFWSQEFWPSASTSVGQVTVPTELERAGDFSRSASPSSPRIPPPASRSQATGSRSAALTPTARRC